jgi:glucose/mannose transport system permease protein
VTCVILLTIQVVRSYDLVVALTGGGPGFASDLPGKFVVDYAFERGNVGLASAAAITMLFSVLAILAPYFWIEMRRRKA